MRPEYEVHLSPLFTVQDSYLETCEVRKWGEGGRDERREGNKNK
jgi:hypothetical protein